MNQQTLYPSSDESNPVGHVDTQTTAQKQPSFITMLALFYGFGGIMFTVFTILSGVKLMNGSYYEKSSDLFLMAVASFCFLGIAYGLWLLKKWSFTVVRVIWIIGILVGVFLLLSQPSVQALIAIAAQALWLYHLSKHTESFA